MAEATNGSDIKIINIPHLSMFTPCPAAEGRRSQLIWAVRNGHPRITVFTNDPNDKIMGGAIIAPMSPVVFDMFLTLMERVIKSTEEIKQKVVCYGTKYEDDKPTNEKQIRAEVFFGKDKDGIVWICLVSNNRPKIRFNFNLSEYHVVTKADGSELTPSEGSALTAAATVSVLRGLMNSLLTTAVENPPPRPPRKGKGQYSNGTQSGGSQYFPNYDTADDIL